ncbi:Trafficking protein particle complex 8, partial [Nowakowskiella sp. JEL0078]
MPWNKFEGREFLWKLCSPLVGVMASPDVTDAIARNNLPSIVDFLRPLGERIPGKVQLRDSQGLFGSVEHWGIRIVDMAYLGQIDPIVSQKVSSYCSRNHPDACSRTGLGIKTAADVDDIFSKASLTEASPWYLQFRDLTCKYIGMFVTTTANTDPLETLTMLSATNSLPSVYNRGYMDPNLLKHYVLIHDQSIETSSETFGISCHILRINSRKPGQVELAASTAGISDIWAPYMRENSLFRNATPEFLSAEDILIKGIDDLTKFQTITKKANLSTESEALYCEMMSEGDVKNAETFLKEFIVQNLVANSRRGLTGRIFSAGRKYFSGTNKTSSLVSNQNPNGTVTHLYPFNSPEMIMRKLADFSLMMRDYRYAFSVYDSVRKDFLADRMPKYAAGTFEMMVVCSLISEGLSKGYIELLGSAVNNYQEAKSLEFASRATILTYELLRYKELYPEAPAALVKIISEDSNLRTGIFLEQAALCYLKCDPPMIRKFAFHLVLAGHRFAKCGQREHAFRSYITALDTYGDGKWSLVNDHIHFSLGRLSFHVQDLSLAVEYFLKLLGTTSKQSPAQQSVFLKEFLHVYKINIPQNFETVGNLDSIRSITTLPLPLLKDSSVKASVLEILDNQQHSTNSSDEEQWEKMEADLVAEGYSVSRGNVGKKVTKSLHNTREGNKTVCAVGEPVFVKFEWQNPLQINLQITEISVVCVYASDTKSFIDIPAGYAVDNQLKLEEKSSTRIIGEHFDVENIPELSFGALEKVPILLRIFPKVKGEIKIIGVRYRLCGTVPTLRRFSKRGKRLNDTKDQRMSIVYAVDNSLNLVVTPPMPVLDVTFHSFPQNLLSGEVSRVILEINNKGNRGLKNLLVKLSHPSFFTAGTSDQVESKISADSKNENREFIGVENVIFNSSMIAIQLPISENKNSPILEAGQMTLIPLWIRGDRIGKHVFRFLFGYQSEDESDKIAYRTLPSTMISQVIPSLRINAFTRPSTKSIHEFILGVEIENLHTSSEVSLRQLTSLSPSWILQPIDIIWTEDRLKLAPKKTMFMYYKFIRANQKMLDDPETSPEALTTKAIKRLIFGEAQEELKAPPINLHISSVSKSTPVSCVSSPFRNLSLNSRVQWRSSSLSVQYPGLTPDKLPNLFTLYSTDDVDLALFWDTPSISQSTTVPERSGHHYVIGINLSLQSPLQIQRIGKTANAIFAASNKSMAKALFAATVRERKTLVNSLLKSRVKDISPVRMIMKTKNAISHDFASM